MSTTGQFNEPGAGRHWPPDNCPSVSEYVECLFTRPVITHYATVRMTVSKSVVAFKSFVLEGAQDWIKI